MKNTTTKKSIVSKLALIALISVMGSYTYGNQHTTGVENIIEVFVPAEKTLSDFFNSNNPTPYKVFVDKFDVILRDFKRKIEAITRTHDDEVSVLINDITDYVAQHFNVLCNIFKKYNGKSSTYFLEFAAEIKREFNTQKIFSEIITKLKVLRGKVADTDKQLVKRIDCLIGLIQVKKNEWSAKPDPALLTALSYRMKCH